MPTNKKVLVTVGGPIGTGKDLLAQLMAYQLRHTYGLKVIPTAGHNDVAMDSERFAQLLKEIKELNERDELQIEFITVDIPTAKLQPSRAGAAKAPSATNSAPQARRPRKAKAHREAKPQ